MVPNLLKEIKDHPIIRRYIIMNTFDGGLTILGIVLASWFAGVKEPYFIILPSVGAGIAMMISGMWGAYAAERAESKASIKEMERHLMRELKGTRVEKKQSRMAIVIAIVDGLSPFLSALIIISPFFLVNIGIFTIGVAYYASFAIVALTLFLLGVFAGKISKESIWQHGLMMLSAGVVITIIFYILTLLGILQAGH